MDSSRSSGSVMLEYFLRLEGEKHSPPRSQRPILIHCFHGGPHCHQLLPFKRAMDLVRLKLPGIVIEVAYLSLSDIRKLKGWSAANFVDWLLSSHLHFITTHIHQGTETFGWHIESLYGELQRLKYHPGFPNMASLGCPMFTQNKMLYLKNLPQCMTMPSFKILISEDMDLEGTRRYVERYVSNTSWLLLLFLHL